MQTDVTCDGQSESGGGEFCLTSMSDAEEGEEGGEGGRWSSQASEDGVGVEEVDGGDGSRIPRSRCSG